jgi:hypothetical protein
MEDTVREHARAMAQRRWKGHVAGRLAAELSERAEELLPADRQKLLQALQKTLQTSGGAA